ncbi:MAG TPA: hypothetical protein DCS87_12550 [Rheinheimera sp.]|nr:hypothetical protein [Rheinheimera sp.]
MKLTAKMNLTKLATGVILPCALWLSPFASQASGYKMVVLSDALPTSSLQSPERADTVAERINSCVSLTKETDPAASQKAEATCHQAVMQAKYAAPKLGSDGRALRAYAYTNRGVQKAMQHDTEGALADFQMAVKLKADAITTHNLDKLNAERAKGL